MAWTCATSCLAAPALQTVRCLPALRDADGRSGRADGQPFELVCGRCLRRPPPQAHARAAFVYGFPLDRLLPRFKFHDDLAATRLLARVDGRRFRRGRTSAGAGAVPLHIGRLRERGYDQALELARPLARGSALPLRDDLLRVLRATAAAVRADAAARRRNLRGAFRVCGHASNCPRTWCWSTTS